MGVVSWKQISGGSVGLAIVTLIILLNYNVTDMTYYCASPEVLRECEFGVSDGLGTMCYDNSNLSAWETCESGWLRALDYIEVVDYEDLEHYLPTNHSKVDVFGMVYVGGPSFTNCELKPDGLNDGWKTCKPFTVFYNGFNESLFLNMSVDNFDISVTKTAKNELFFYSTDFVNNEWIDYKIFDGSVLELQTGRAVSVLSQFEIPQYESAWYNVSYLPENFILDPEIGVCGSLASSGVYTLNNNINTTTSCFIISASDVVLDCAGFTVQGDFVGTDYGVDFSGYLRNITVKNCVLQNFFGAEIRQGAGYDYYYINNSFKTVGTNNGRGIYTNNGVGDVYNVNIINNTFDNWGSNSGVGIGYVQTSEWNNRIINLRIEGNLFKSRYSVRPHTVGGSVYIINNTFAKDITNEAINMRSMSVVDKIVVTGNVFNNSCISMDFNTRGEVVEKEFVIENNTFSETSVSLYVNHPSYLKFRNNVITKRTLSNVMLLSREGSCTDCIFENNNFTLASTIFGLYEGGGNVIIRNNIVNSGANNFIYDSSTNEVQTVEAYNNLIASPSTHVFANIINYNPNSYYKIYNNTITTLGTFYKGEVYNNFIDPVTTASCFDIGSGEDIRIYNNNCIMAGTYNIMFNKAGDTRNVIIENNNFTTFSTTTYALGFFGAGNTVSDIIIRNNNFSGNFGTGVGVRALNCIHKNISIYNNYFNVLTNSFYILNSYKENDFIIENNIFYQNSAIATHIYSENANKSLTIKNNTILGKDTYSTAFIHSLVESSDKPFTIINYNLGNDFRIIAVPLRFIYGESSYGMMRILRGFKPTHANTVPLINESLVIKNNSITTYFGFTRGIGGTVSNRWDYSKRAPIEQALDGFMIANLTSDYTFGTGDFTIQFWYAQLRRTSTSTAVSLLTSTKAYANIIYIGKGAATSTYGQVQVMPGTLQYTGVDIKGSNWHLITFTRNGTGAGQTRICVDKKCESFTHATNYNNVAFINIFSAGTTAHHGWGSMDNLRVYNRSLSWTEINQTYDQELSGKQLTTVSNEGLLDIWTFDGDYTSNNNKTFYDVSGDCYINYPMAMNDQDGIEYSFIELNSSYPTGTNSFSVGGYVQQESLVKENALFYYGSDDINKGIFALFDNNRLSVYAHPNTLLLSTVISDPRQFKLTMVTFDTSTKNLSLYVDGVLKNSTVYSSLNIGQGFLRMGRAYEEYAQTTLYGKTGDFFVYNTAINSGAQKQIINSVQFFNDTLPTNNLVRRIEQSETIKSGTKRWGGKELTELTFYVNANNVSVLRYNESCGSLCSDVTYNKDGSVSFYTYADGLYIVNITGTPPIVISDVPFCTNEQLPYEVCRVVTPKLSCSSDATIFYQNLSVYKNVSLTSVSDSDGVYYFDFNESVGDYLFQLCDGSSRQLKVWNTLHNMSNLSLSNDVAIILNQNIIIGNLSTILNAINNIQVNNTAIANCVWNEEGSGCVNYKEIDNIR